MEIFEKILTKKQFIFELANTLQLTERKAEMLFDIFFNLIIKELLKGKKSSLSRLWHFLLTYIKTPNQNYAQSYKSRNQKKCNS